MSSKVSKGIALLLFGILLCAGSGEINTVILSAFSDFPFSTIGVIVGAVGLGVQGRIHYGRNRYYY